MSLKRPGIEEMFSRRVRDITQKSEKGLRILRKKDKRGPAINSKEGHYKNDFIEA